MSKQLRKKNQKHKPRVGNSPKSNLIKLYETAFSILYLSPWDHFTSENYFVQLAKKDRQIILARTMGIPDGGCGVLIYPEFFSFSQIDFTSATQRQEKRSYIESNHYAVFFDTWEDLPPDAQQDLRRADLASPDFPVFPWFSHKCYGHPSASLEPQDYAVLADCLGNLSMQYRSILEQKQEVDFKNGEVALRFFNPSAQLWYNVSTKLELPPHEFDPVMIRRESPKLAALLKCPACTEKLRVEFDFGWDQVPTEDAPGKPPYHKMVVAFTDRTSGNLLSYYSCRPEELMDAAFTAWDELIKAHGRPETLYLSRPETIALFQDFADALGVKVKPVKRLPANEQIFRANDLV